MSDISSILDYTSTIFQEPTNESIKSIKTKSISSQLLTNLHQTQSIPVSGHISVFKFNSTGFYLASGALTGQLSIFKLENGSFQALKEFNDHSNSILDIAWSMNNFIATASVDKTVRVYHLNHDSCLCALIHQDIVTSILFHPFDDRYILTGSLDSRVRIWSLEDKKVVYWNEGASNSYITAVCFTHDASMGIIN